MKKSTVILSNSLKSLSYLFEFLPFLCNPLTNTTSSSNHIPLWKESVSPLFSNIKSSTQTSYFLLCHIPEDLAWSLVSPSPWILPFPYCFLLLCLLPHLQKLPSPWFLSNYIFFIHPSTGKSWKDHSRLSGYLHLSAILEHMITLQKMFTWRSLTPA